MMQTGNAGGLISQSANGARSAKTIRRTAHHGNRSLMIKHEVVRIAGVKMVCWELPTGNVGCVLGWLCGTVAIRF